MSQGENGRHGDENRGPVLSPNEVSRGLQGAGHQVILTSHDGSAKVIIGTTGEAVLPIDTSVTDLDMTAGGLPASDSNEWFD